MTIAEMTESRNIMTSSNDSVIDFIAWLFAGGRDYIDQKIDKESLYYSVWKYAGTMNSYYASSGELAVMTTIWCKNNEYFMRELAKTIEFDYNPIENYDRHEENDGNNDQTRNLTRPFDEQSLDSTSAYNVESFRNVDKTERRGSTGDNGSVKDKSHFTSYIHGNIGVTTTQQMIDFERNIVDFSLVDAIARKYVNDNFIRVW